MTTGVAQAERPATSATAAVDNLLEDLEEKRYAIAVKLLAPRVTLQHVSFRGACKKAFPNSPVASSVAFAKCLVSDLTWEKKAFRFVGNERKTADGWVVDFGGLEFGVRSGDLPPKR